MVTQKDIARQVGLDVSSVSKILTRRSGLSFCPETVGRVFQVARELGYELGRIKHFHRREADRVLVNIPTRVAIYFREDGARFDQGTCMVRDLSAGGADLTGLFTERRTLPLEPFFLGIRLRHEEMEEFELRGHLLRFTFDEGLPRIAIRLQPLSPEVGERLRQLLRSRQTGGHRSSPGLTEESGTPGSIPR